MDNWDTLKSWIQIHASLESVVTPKMVLEYMETLEGEEKRFASQLEKEGLMRREPTVFLNTDVPTFDQNTWIQILEERGLQGLS